MLRRPVQALLGVRFVDQTLQLALGSWRTRAALAAAVSRHAQRAGVVLDLGGGGGRLRGLWTREARYICLDPDRQKLDWIRRGEDGTLPVEGDGTRLPIRSGSLDAIVCRSVIHHLSPEQLSRVLGECARTLHPAGVFFLVDPLWAPRRPLARALWRLDRGSSPRTEREIEEAFRDRFEILGKRRLSYVHEYVLLVGRPVRGKIGVASP